MNENTIPDPKLSRVDLFAILVRSFIPSASRAQRIDQEKSGSEYQVILGDLNDDTFSLNRSQCAKSPKKQSVGVYFTKNALL